MSKSNSHDKLLSEAVTVSDPPSVENLSVSAKVTKISLVCVTDCSR